MRPAGYLVNHPGGLQGEQGLFYDYLVASNGVFIRAENPLLKATIYIAEADIRGLAPLQEKVELVHGKVPDRLGQLATSIMQGACDREVYVAIAWEGEYRLRMPEQCGEGVSVEYHCVPNTVVELHSHGRMQAFFSSTDTRDEQGLRVYGVIGEANNLWPTCLLRIGIYGYFGELLWRDVFE